DVKRSHSHIVLDISLSLGRFLARRAPGWQGRKMDSSRLTLIVLAGQRPGIDPLAEHFGEPFKALIDVAGQPMLAWVGATLAARDDVNRIVILAQDSEALLDHPKTRWLRDEPHVTTRRCGDSIVEAIIATLRAMPIGYPFLLTTADNVLLDDAI